ncbi:hypothetical protein NCS56_00262200 [Fusarium sp. Ph1]|nr:hypothetical protein NCS56_00262200 [Fusarium sp. Ph1]
MSAPSSVRVSGPPNSSFLVGYPGISTTLPRIEGKVEIRPGQGYSMPVPISLVRICLQRRETIHPDADSLAKRHLGAPRRETTDLVGKEQLLFRCASGRGRPKRSSPWTSRLSSLFPTAAAEKSRTDASPQPLSSSRVEPPRHTTNSSSRSSRATATSTNTASLYHFCATIPSPLLACTTNPESKLVTNDNIVHLGINLPRWSYGPSDPITVYIKLSPNTDWLHKAKRVTIDKITLTIEEERLHTTRRATNPQRKPQLSFKGFADPDGVIKRGKPQFPLYEVTSFTTTSTLYKIEFYLSIKVNLSGARDTIILANDRDSLRALGLCMVGGQKKPFIE